MREIPISKFRASCLSVLEDVNQTGQPVVVTRFGKPVAQISPLPPAKKKRWLGCMSGSMEIVGDIVGPIGAFDDWWAAKD